jgi:PAS domain S-box-containing protein
MSQTAPSTAVPDPLAFLAGGGEMGERTRAFDWSKTPVGPAAGWPRSLKTVVRIMLDSRYAMWLGWGPDFTFFYNDAYGKMTLGPKHPWALGQSARDVWSEIWSDIGPRAESVIRTGQATWDEGLLLFLERRGFPEETYHTFSYSPVPDDQGGIGGMLCVVTEDTDRTIGERRLRSLRELAARTTDPSKSAEDACQTAAQSLAGNPRDLAFALFYLLDTEGGRGQLAGIYGLQPGTPASPAVIDLRDRASPWPLHQVAETGKALDVVDLAAKFGPLPGGAWPESPRQAVVLPMAKAGQAQPAGFIVVGLSPRLAFTDEYRGFLDLLASQVATAVSNARAFEEEKRRGEALTELDRAKTTFFSNVSHEFRTPLTLMLGPIEDILAKPPDRLLPENRELLEVASRNGLRLLRLVNTLLDFSRIEAGRVRAIYQATDLGTFTADLASVFRAACERAGLRLVVDCPPLPEPVYVDREMWEKVVLNLLSNAFKFTFEGEIAVDLHTVGTAVELRVRDTGTGIPAEEMPRLFERFHRVANARGRTHEGSGIGLALVQELLRLHGGTISAESDLGRGATFTASIPLGSAHLPAEQIGSAPQPAATRARVSAYVEEELSPGSTSLSSSEGSQQPSTVSAPAIAPPGTFRADNRLPLILLADDNADMRQYVARLLAEKYRVETVPDGEAALEAIRRELPELVLTDVMMPRLDGFGLLRKLRADPALRGLPVVMLSARAGEESRVEGVEAGADDYLVKPFSARELQARVSAQLQMARLRREASAIVRQGEERLRMALAAARMVAWQLDLATGKILASDNAGEMLGLPTGVTLETSEQAFSLIHPDDAEQYQVTVRNALKQERGYSSQYRICRPDNGAVLWLEERGNAVFARDGGVIGLVGVFLDITQRKEAEERLARLTEEADRERRLFDTVLSNTGDLNSIFDLDGRFVFANKALLNLWRKTEDQIVGRTMGELGYPPDVEAQVLNDLRQVVQTRRSARNETRYVTPAGEAGYYEYVLAPVSDASGAVVQVAGSSRDITDRKRAEQRLRDSEQRFRFASDAVNGIIYEHDLQTGSVERSRGLYEVLGYHTDEVPATFAWWLEQIHPDDRDILLGFDTDSDHNSRVSDYRVRHNDGRWLHVEDRSVVMKDGGGNPVKRIGCTTDVTERKRAEQELRSHKEHLELAQSAGRIGTFEWDISTGAVRWSPVAEDLYGLPPGGFGGTYENWKEALHPDDRDRAETHLSGAVLDRKELRTEFRIVRPDQTTRWIAARGTVFYDDQRQPLRMIGVHLDITASKLAEQRVRLLWEAAAVLLTTDEPDPMLRQIFDRISPHLKLDTYFNYMVNETGTALQLASCVGIPDETARGIKNLAFGQAVCGTVAVVRHPIVATFIQESEDPKVQLVRSFGIRAYACSPLMAGDRLLGTLSFASRTRDQFDSDELEFLRTICQYVAAAYERLGYIHQLREADRRKDEFLATLAHELRNPLAPLRNGLQIMRLARNDTHAVDQARGMMERQLGHMVRLIDDLLDLSRISRGKVELRKERVELTKAVRHAVETSRPLIEESGHELKIDIASGPLFVDADLTRLSQVISNLLNNAAKYTERGGLVTLTVDRQRGDAVVTVRDTGVGIPAHMLPKVFEMFTQVDRSLEKSRGGLGIGLSLVKGLVEMHGGSVEARSEGHGRGSEFVVRLPVVLSLAGQSADEDSQSRVGPGGQRRVLVVDDSHDSATSLAMMLQLMGYETRAAHDGLEALEVAEDFRPRVILLDIGMPKLNGYDTARRLRQETWGKHIVLVALTGWGQDDDKRRSHEAGFNYHLVKPVDIGALEKLLADVQTETG